MRKKIIWIFLIIGISITLFLIYSDPPPLPFNKTERLFMSAYQKGDFMVFVSSDSETVCCYIESVNNRAVMKSPEYSGLPVPYQREFEVFYMAEEKHMSPQHLVSMVRYNNFKEGFVSYVDFSIAGWLNHHKDVRIMSIEKPTFTYLDNGEPVYVFNQVAECDWDGIHNANPANYVIWSERYGIIELSINGGKSWYLKEMTRNGEIVYNS